MKGFQVFLAFLGRVCLSLIFIIGGLKKIFDWQSVEQGVVATLCDWHAYVEHYSWAAKFFESLLPYVPILLGIATFCELFGGLLIFFGIKVRFGAFLLFLFLVPATILYHSYWMMEGQKHELELSMFLKNLAILGGIFTLIVFGSGKKKQVEFE